MGDSGRLDVIQDAVKMTIRAFYSDNSEFVVLMDAILRERNYVSDDYLASKLRLPAKDIRQTLVHLRDQRLIASQKREFHKKILKNPNRTRRVHKEYFYVDYISFIDMLKYRIDKIERDLRERVSAEAAQQQVYNCPRCGKQYTALQVVELLDYATDSFICNQPANRRMTCKGILKEEDTLGRRAELEGKQKRFDKELRPLLEQIKQCDAIRIPKQPDEEAAEIEPDSIDLMDDALMDADQAEAGMNVIIDIPEDENEEQTTNLTALEQPTWFTGEETGENDAETGENEDQPAIAAETEDADDGQSYYAKYLSKQQLEAERTNEASRADLPPEKHDGDLDTAQGDITEEEPLISVGDELIPISEVTAHHTERMTTEQYNVYKSKYHEVYG